MDQIVKERKAWDQSGVMGIVIVGLLYFLALYFFFQIASQPLFFFLAGLFGFLGFLGMSGFFVVQPLEGRVIQFFGHYLGTARETGLRWTIPFTTKEVVSLRLRNFESPRLKVNEADGNPIEIGAIVVWKVVDTAQAVFNVENLSRFVEKQTESSVRALATKYPYDKYEGHKLSLHGNLDEINEQLTVQVRKSLVSAGVEIVEARISHLAYAPEIAAAMLQRQQAQAIISARQRIVDGAVGMVEMALKQLHANGVVQLNEDRKAAMVSNLLVVLCSERPSQPVVNAGIST